MFPVTGTSALILAGVTGLAASATGKAHALVGAIGMLFGAMLYAASFDWVSLERR